MEKNNEHKSVEQLAAAQCPLNEGNSKSDYWINGFIAGHTAASSGMVKKDEVVKLVQEHLSYFNSTGPIGTQLTELLTQIKEL